MLRRSRPWRSPLQARDFATRRLGPRPRRRVCLALCHLSLRAVTAHHAPSLPRPRNRLLASGVGGLTRPSFGGRSGIANSNAPERAQVQSDLASRRRNQAPSGDPVRTRLLEGSAVRFLLAPPRSPCDPAALRASGNSSVSPPLRRGFLG